MFVNLEQGSWGRCSQQLNSCPAPPPLFLYPHPTLAKWFCSRRLRRRWRWRRTQPIICCQTGFTNILRSSVWRQQQATGDGSQGGRKGAARLHACNALSESRLNVVVLQCPPLHPTPSTPRSVAMLTHSAHSIRFSCSFCCYLQPIMRDKQSRCLKSPRPQVNRLTWALKSKKYSGLSGQGRPHLQVPCDSK